MPKNGHEALIIGGSVLGGIALYEIVKTSSGLSSAAPTSEATTGAVLNYTATIITGWTQSVSDVLAAVKNDLQASGLNVLSSSENVSIGQEALDAISLQSQTSGVSIQVQVTGSGYAKGTDVQSIIDHAIYTETGSLPSSSSIVFTSAGSGAASAPSAPGLFDSLGLSGLATNLESLGTGTVIGLAVAAIGVIALLAVQNRPSVSV